MFGVSRVREGLGSYTPRECTALSEAVSTMCLPFRVGVLCPLGNLLNDSPQSCPLLVTCLGQVRNSSPPWFGGEGAASLRTPNCRRALGLLLLDWSSVVLNHSPGSIQARWETLRVQQGSCLCWFVRAKFISPNAPNFCEIGGNWKARPCAALSDQVL